MSNDPIIFNDPAPNTADEEALIAALVQALWDAPGVVVAAALDVQSRPAAEAA